MIRSTLASTVVLLTMFHGRVVVVHTYATNLVSDLPRGRQLRPERRAVGSRPLYGRYRLEAAPHTNHHEAPPEASPMAQAATPGVLDLSRERGGWRGGPQGGGLGLQGASPMARGDLQGDPRTLRRSPRRFRPRRPRGATEGCAAATLARPGPGRHRAALGSSWRASRGGKRRGAKACQGGHPARPPAQPKGQGNRKPRPKNPRDFLDGTPSGAFHASTVAEVARGRR